MFRQTIAGDWKDTIEQLKLASYNEFPTFSQIAPRSDGYQLALSLYSNSRFDDAMATLRPLLALSPEIGMGATYNLAAACSFSMGRMEDAETYWRHAIQSNPEYASAHNNLGVLLKQLKRLPEAELAFRQALGVSPRYAEAHSNLGALLYDLGHLEEAEASCRQALAINPSYCDAQYNLGVVLYSLKRLGEAELSYWKVLESQPGHINALNNLCVLLQELGRLQEAREICEHALIIDPTYYRIHNSFGVVLKELDRLPQAEARYRQALALSCNDYADAKFNLASLLLGTGRLTEGWPLYEARYEKGRMRPSSFAPGVSCPQWRGEPLTGKSLLVW
ncbi:tetratricopeptide repeat protein, partial [Paraburkholderia sp. RCC_158]|uniref:tetratricopeptide repeat protein n=1 Tax=Paraburkholderia sp. RCC_158 TaxID=3239220 RepID=UPI00352610CC